MAGFGLPNFGQLTEAFRKAQQIQQDAQKLQEELDAMEIEGNMPMDAGINTPQAPMVFDNPPGIKPLSKGLLRRASATTVHAHDEEGIGVSDEFLNRSSLRGQ